MAVHFKLLKNDSIIFVYNFFVVTKNLNFQLKYFVRNQYKMLLIIFFLFTLKII